MEKKGEVKLADEQTIALLGCMHVPVEITDRWFLHMFQIVPTMSNLVILRIDIWAKIGITVFLPSPFLDRNKYTTAATGGLNKRTAVESELQQLCILCRVVVVRDNIKAFPYLALYPV